MLYQCSTRYPHNNYKREYGKLPPSFYTRWTSVPTLYSASDFAEGESWGYGRFYELSKLVSKHPLSSQYISSEYLTQEQLYTLVAQGWRSIVASSNRNCMIVPSAKVRVDFCLLMGLVLPASRWLSSWGHFSPEVQCASTHLLPED